MPVPGLNPIIHLERLWIRRAVFAQVLVLSLVALSGCATTRGRNRESVLQSVESRFGVGIGSETRDNFVVVPQGLDEGRPVTEELAVLIALWNNAAFREALVELDLTRADLVQAGLLPNPEFVYLWPARQAAEVSDRLSH